MQKFLFFQVKTCASCAKNDKKNVLGQYRQPFPKELSYILLLFQYKAFTYSL